MSRVLYRLALREVSLFSTCPENTLKTRAVPDSLSYRLRGADTRLRLLPPVSVFRSSSECSENKNHSEFPLLQTVGKLGGVCCAVIGGNMLEM